MANIIIGKVAPTFKGAWSSKQTYFRLDIVSYNGSSYACIAQTNIGTIPDSNSSVWVLVASKGDVGNVDVTVGNKTFNDY